MFKIKTSPFARFSHLKKLNPNPIVFKNIFIFVLRTTKNKMMIYKNIPAVHAQASGTSDSKIQLNTFQSITYSKKR